MSDPYLPPGVRVSDLPGNSKSDEAYWRASDRAAEEIEADLRDAELPEWMVEVAADAIVADERFRDYVESRMSDGYDEPPTMEWFE